MGFADAYLQKAGLRGKLVDSAPHPDLKIIVAIPAYNESGLERCLDSLFRCGVSSDSSGDSDSGRKEVIRAEVVVLINAPFNAPDAVLRQNTKTYDAALKWISAHPHPFIDFHILMDHTFENKEAGVGLARKILMDEAVRRFNSIGARNGKTDGAKDGIIASMDADAVVDENYLMAVADHFESVQPDGSSIYFEHPLSGESFAPGVYDAVIQYELHLRYYLQSIRSTGYPHAFHTVGSSFAVKAEVYCKEGGMNRKKAGEDFYFIQKIAQRGNFSECNKTRVIPSPRPSDRVPFGTGAAVRKYLKESVPLNTYNPGPFRMLKKLFSGLEILHSNLNDAPDRFLNSQSEVLLEFLNSQRFVEALSEIRQHSATFPAFQKRFWRWFTMFRMMKFLHYARENGYPDVPVGEASLELLTQINPDGVEIPANSRDLGNLLGKFRRIEQFSRNWDTG